MVQAILKEVIGAGTITFGSGADAAREVPYNGKAPYPSPENPWDGYWIFQVKFLNVRQIYQEIQQMESWWGMRGQDTI